MNETSALLPIGARRLALHRDRHTRIGELWAGGGGSAEDVGTLFPMAISLGGGEESASCALTESVQKLHNELSSFA